MTESNFAVRAPAAPECVVAEPTPLVQRVTLVSARRRNPQATVPSPCVGVCKMDDVAGWCKGCFRTLDELTGWSRATDVAKLAVWARVEQRQR